jgi:hypothetical protein
MDQHDALLLDSKQTALPAESDLRKRILTNSEFFHVLQTECVPSAAYFSDRFGDKPYAWEIYPLAAEIIK